jgi:hypothetical protein
VQYIRDLVRGGESVRPIPLISLTIRVFTIRTNGYPNVLDRARRRTKPNNIKLLMLLSAQPARAGVSNVPGSANLPIHISVEEANMRVVQTSEPIQTSDRNLGVF